MQTAAQWHAQTQQQPNQRPLMPLRQKLLQVLMGELLTRLTKLAEATDKSELRQTALQNMILLPDLTCPYQEWDPIQRKLKVSQRQPISLQKMINNVQEFMDMCAQPDLIHRFHSLPPQENVTPWRLQLSLRADREYELMKVFCQSSIWTLMGVTVKAHNHHQSGLASTLAVTLGLQSAKGKTKGSGKGKTKTQNKVK